MSFPGEAKRQEVTMQRDATKTPFSWDNSLDLGVAEVDHEHQHFFDLLGCLHEGIAAGWAAPAVGQLLRELEDQTRFHFLCEEVLLEQSACPELLRHRGARMGFLEHLADLECSGKALTTGTVERMGDWMVAHIRASRVHAAWLTRAAASAAPASRRAA
jgi:hemerythrin